MFTVHKQRAHHRGCKYQNGAGVGGVCFCSPTETLQTHDHKRLLGFQFHFLHVTCLSISGLWVSLALQCCRGWNASSLQPNSHSTSRCGARNVWTVQYLWFVL